MQSKAEREEMSELSQMLLGSRSRWQKILAEGVLETVTTTVQETVPGENGEPDTVKESVVPKLLNGRPYKQAKYYSFEELRAKLLEQKAALEKAMADHQAAEEAKAKEKKEKEELEQVHKKLVGSAI